MSEGLYLILLHFTFHIQLLSLGGLLFSEGKWKQSGSRGEGRCGEELGGVEKGDDVVGMDCIR